LLVQQEPNTAQNDLELKNCEGSENGKHSCECPVLPYTSVYRNCWRQDIRLDRLLLSISTYVFIPEIFQGDILQIHYYSITLISCLNC